MKGFSDDEAKGTGRRNLIVLPSYTTSWLLRLNPQDCHRIVGGELRPKARHGASSRDMSNQVLYGPVVSFFAAGPFHLARTTDFFQRKDRNFCFVQTTNHHEIRRNIGR